MYELADPYNATINVYVKLCHQFKREGPGSCFTTTGLLSVKLCHQIRKSLCIRKISVHTLPNRGSIKGWDGTTILRCLAGWIQA